MRFVKASTASGSIRRTCAQPPRISFAAPARGIHMYGIDESDVGKVIRIPPEGAEDLPHRFPGFAGWCAVNRISGSCRSSTVSSS